MSEYEIKRLKLARITTIAVVSILAIVLIAAAVLCITLVRYESRVDQIVTDLETVTAQLSQADVGNMVETLESLTAQLESIPWTEVAENINGLAVTAQESLWQVEQNLGDAMDSLNSLDIEKLNKAIGDLQAVIEPLARFAGRFG